MKTFLLFIACFFATAIMAQTPTIQWQQYINIAPSATSVETANAIRATPDGGFITAGDVLYNDAGAKYGHHDYFAAKLDGSGNILWKKTYGGSEEEQAYDTQLTADGGYILAGFSSSGDGDITSHHGARDVWIVKLNANGNIKWQKTYGGSGDDVATSIAQTPDGGYIIAGSSVSADGDVTGGNKGNYDAWLFKINSTGVIEWQKSYGGGSGDVASGVTVQGSNYYFALNSSSTTDAFTGTYGETDIWVIKLDSLGNQLMKRHYGGSQYDYVNGIQATADGGCILAAYTRSVNHDVTGNHNTGGNGPGDAWVVKLSATGGIDWQKCYGTTDNEMANAVQQIPNGYIVVGMFNVGPSFNGAVIKIKGDGTLVSQIHYGGNLNETFNSVAIVPTGFAAAGINASYPATQGHRADAWVVRFLDTSIHSTAPYQFITFPALPVRRLGDADYAPGAYASSGLPVTYTSSDTNVASIVNSKIHVKALGTATITATQNGNALYNGAAPVTQLLTVNKKLQVIHFPVMFDKVVTAPDFIIIAYASSGLPLTFRVQDTSIATIVKGSFTMLHLKKVGTTTVWAYQGGNDVYAAADSVGVRLNVIKATQDISFYSISPKTVCDTDYTPTITATSGLPVTLISSDTSVISIINGKLHFKAPGYSSLTALQPGNEYYAPATPSSMLLTVSGRVTPAIVIKGLTAMNTVGVKAYLFSRHTGVGLANISANSTVLVAPGNQPAVMPLVSLPFDFYFGGSYYNTFSVNEHGILRLGSVPLNRDDYPGTPSLGKQPSIYAWFSRMGIGANGSVRYKITGAAGSRRIVVEWNVRDSAPGNFDRTIQAWLYEGSFKIQFVYSHTAEIEGKGKIGVSNPSNDFLVLNPALNQATNTVNRSSNNFPASGTSYLFTVPGIQQVCPASKSVQYNVDVIHMGSPTRYQWMKNNTPTGINNAMHIDRDPHTGDSIWCVVTTSGVCTSTPVVTSNKVYEVIERLMPAVAVTGKPNLCTGDTASFRATVNNAGATPHYQWMKNGTAVGTDADLYTSTALVTGDSVWVLVTVAAADTACSSTPVITSNKITVKVNTYTTPVLTVTTAPAGSICAGTPVTFKAQSNAGNVHSYQWVKNGIAVGTDSSRYNTASLANNDTVWAVGTDITGCVLANTAVSNKVVKMVSSAPPAAAGAISGPATVSSGQTGITYSVTNVAGVNYLWQAPAAVIVSGQGTSSITVNWGSTAGNVNVTAQNACGSAEKVTLHVEVAGSLTGTLSSTGSSESIQLVRNDVRVMPNPATNMAYVVFNAAGTYKYSLQLTDGMGKVVFTRDGYAVKGENRVAIDVTRMANALYYIRLNDKQYGTRSAKLVVGK